MPGDPAPDLVLIQSSQLFPASESVLDLPSRPGYPRASAALTFQTRAKEAEAIVAVARRITTADPHASVGVISRSGGRRSAVDAAFAAASDIPCRRWDLAIDDPLIRDRIRVVVAGLPKAASVEEARRACMANVDPSDVDTAEDLNDAFDQLAADDGRDAAVRHVLARYRHADDELIAFGPGVHLLNAHTAKGHQFDWVFVVGLEEGQMPIFWAKTAEAIAEEQRVLLVMLSRARHGAIVTRSSLAEGRYGPFTVTDALRHRDHRWMPA